MSVNVLMVVLGVLGVFVVSLIAVLIKSLFRSDDKRHIYVDDDSEIIELSYEDLINSDNPLELLEDYEEDEDEFEDEDEDLEDYEDEELVVEKTTTGQETELVNLVKVSVKQSGLDRKDIQRVIEKGGAFKQRMISLFRTLAGYDVVKPVIQPIRPIVPVRIESVPQASLVRAAWRQVWIIALIFLAFGLYKLYPTIKVEATAMYETWQEELAEDQKLEELRLEERLKNTKTLIGVVQKFKMNGSEKVKRTILLVIKLSDAKENAGEKGLYTLRITGSDSALKLLHISLKNGKTVKFTRYPELKRTRRGNLNIEEIAVIK